MDPTPDTPFREVSPDWWLSARCRCKIVGYHANHRQRFGPDMTAALLVARLRCPKCGERPREAAWETWDLPLSRNQEDIRRVRVV